MDEKKVKAMVKIMQELYSLETPYDASIVLSDVVLNYILGVSKTGCALPALESFFEIVKIRMVEAEKLGIPKALDAFKDEILKALKDAKVDPAVIIENMMKGKIKPFDFRNN